MKSFNGNTSDRVVGPDGTVSVGGFRRGKIIRLRTGRWIYARPGGQFTSESWPNRELVIDALIAATNPQEKHP